jgi:hypothetical protein
MKTFAFNNDKYCSDNGEQISREYGKTPNGNPLNGRWVLRSKTGVWIDFDKYVNDLAERHNINLRYPENSIIHFTNIIQQENN